MLFVFLYSFFRFFSLLWACNDSEKKLCKEIDKSIFYDNNKCTLICDDEVDLYYDKRFGYMKLRLTGKTYYSYSYSEYIKPNLSIPKKKQSKHNITINHYVEK